MPTDDPTDPFDRFIRKREILADLGVNASTLHLWIKKKFFPEPTILNPNVGGREIIGWPLSTYVNWKRALPVRQAKVVSQRPYEKRRKRKLARPTK